MPSAPSWERAVPAQVLDETRLAVEAEGLGDDGAVEKLPEPSLCKGCEDRVLAALGDDAQDDVCVTKASKPRLQHHRTHVNTGSIHYTARHSRGMMHSFQDAKKSQHDTTEKQPNFAQESTATKASFLYRSPFSENLFADRRKIVEIVHSCF